MSSHFHSCHPNNAQRLIEQTKYTQTHTHMFVIFLNRNFYNNNNNNKTFEINLSFTVDVPQEEATIPKFSFWQIKNMNNIKAKSSFSVPIMKRKSATTIIKI